MGPKLFCGCCRAQAEPAASSPAPWHRTGTLGARRIYPKSLNFLYGNSILVWVCILQPHQGGDSSWSRAL